MITRFRTTLPKEQGFTLVELLVVIVVIGILAAIAVPIMLQQRQKANDAAVRNDLKYVAVQTESVFIGNSTIVSPVGADGVSPDLTELTRGDEFTLGGNDINLSPGVIISIVDHDSDADGEIDGYRILGWHINGSYSEENPLVWDSQTGLFVD